MKMNISIAIDFDGTIVEHAYPHIGKPVPNAISLIKFLKRHGAQIFLWTMRDGQPLEEAVEFCKRHGIIFDGINENPSQWTWTSSRKLYANYYIGDDAIGCPVIKEPGKRAYVDWAKLKDILLERISND